MKILKLTALAAVLSVSLLAFASMPCDSTVWNGASVDRHNLSVNIDTSSVNQAISHLMDEGAVVRVWTVPPTNSLDTTEQQLIASCPSWAGIGNHLKNTMVVFLLDPLNGHMGTYAGETWGGTKEHPGPLGEVAQASIRNAMGPYFKNGNYAPGFVAGLQQATSRIVAAKDMTIHPNESKTVVQATDMNGLWSAFKWALFLGFMVFLGWLGWTAYVAYRRKKEKVEQAQEDAIAAKNEAARKLNEVSDSSVEWLALNPTNSSASQVRALVSLSAENYGRLNGSVSNDPDTMNLSEGAYQALGTQYRRISQDLDRASNLMVNSSYSSSGNGEPERPRSKNANFGVSYGSSSSNPAVPKDEEPKKEVVTTRTTRHTFVDSYSPPVFVDPMPVVIPIPVEVPYDGSYGVSTAVGIEQPEEVYDLGPSAPSLAAPKESGGSSDYKTREPSEEEEDTGSSNDYNSDDNSSSSDTGGSSDY